LAVSIIVVVARWSGQPLGIERGWNMAVLAVVLGPVLEEVIFRGYLLTFALWLTRCASHRLCSAVSVIGIAVLFAFAHVGKSGTTVLRFSCIVMTGCLYGWLRLHYQSTTAAALTHAMYNCALYLRYWSGI
jgi:membrane protease YdiL (CAAX protease family)